MYILYTRSDTLLIPDIYLVRYIDPTIIITCPQLLLGDPSSRNSLIEPGRRARASTTVVPFLQDTVSNISIHPRSTYECAVLAVLRRATNFVHPAVATTSVKIEFWNMTLASALHGRPRYTTLAREYPVAA